MAEEHEAFNIEDAPAYENKSSKKKKEKFFTPKVILLCLVCVGLLIGLIVTAGKQKTVIKEVTVPVYVTHKADAEKPATTTIKPAAKPTGTWSSYRLPEYVTPSHYKLRLSPNLTSSTYEGEVDIDLTITQKTGSIILHSNGLVITSSVLIKGDVATNLSEHIPYDKYDFYEMRNPAVTFKPGKYKLLLHFSGSLEGDIHGLYKATYQNKATGNESAIVTSDMEPMDARKAFPCFDEPSMKAKFTVSIVHDSDLIALSNMAVRESKVRGDGLTETFFNTSSVPMSTYLTCFVVCDYSYVETTSKRGIPLRIYAEKFRIDSGRADYSLNVTKVVFDYFEELFDMNYHLPKLDQIAIPDFNSGAMENWGLITYRYTAILWDETKSSAENKQRVATVVAHELVHMWFGNTVTMKWWNNLWLNEGFASYFEYFGVNKAEPTWNMFDQIFVADIKRAMAMDDQETSRPIIPDISNVTTKVNASGQFDAIPYSKGASVLRMIHDMLGEDVFMEGVRRYLKKYQFQNTEESDLWNMWQEVCDERRMPMNVATMLNPWFLQMGYPVLTIANDKNQMTVTQQRYLSDKADETLPAELDYKWNIEVKYEINGVEKRQILNQDDDHITLSVKETDGLKVNSDQFGYYMVNYDSSRWKKIQLQLELDHTKFSVRDRAGFIHDAFKLAMSKRLNYTAAMDMTTYLDREDSYVVWKVFQSYCSFLSSRMANSEEYETLKKYFMSKLKPQADKLGWASTESHLDNLKRSVILSLSLLFGDETALAEIKREFQLWIKNETYHINPDRRALVYSYGVKNSGLSEWAVVFERFVLEEEANEKTRLLNGVTATTNVTLISAFLECTKNSSIIKQQDLLTALVYAGWTGVGNEITWSWVKYNWEFLTGRYGPGSRTLNKLVPYLAGRFSTEIGLWEVENLYKSLPGAMVGAEENKGRLVSNIKQRIMWLQENEDVIISWLRKYNLP